VSILSNLFRTKTVEQSIAETEEPRTSLKRSLTTRDLTVFGVAAVIGAGIFTLTARTAGDLAGPAVSLAFVLAAAACGLAALCYAEFASTVPVAGSAYTFAYATFGEVVAWIIGWDLVLELALAASVIAKGWSLYLAGLLGSDTSFSIGSIRLDWGSMAIVVAITTVLVLGVKLSSRVSAIFTAIKVAVVMVVIVIGVFYIDTRNYRPYIPAPEGAVTPTPSGHLHQTLLSFLTGADGSVYGWYGLLAAASLVFFAFIGFDVIATTSEEAKDPQRSIPRAIIGSLLIVTVLYVAVTVVLTGMIHYQKLRTGSALVGDGGATLATAFAYHGVTWAETVINIGALAGLTTAILIFLIGQSRVLFAMSRDGLLPASWSRTSRGGNPTALTIGVGATVALISSALPIQALEEMVNIGTLFAFVAVCTGVIVLRRTRPDLKRGFRVPWSPYVPIAAIVSCAWLMINLSVATWLRFLCWLALGVVVYFLYGRKHSRLNCANSTPAETSSHPARIDLSRRSDALDSDRA